MQNKLRFEGRIVWIELTQGKETCIDFEDWSAVIPYRWRASKGRKTWYARTVVTRPDGKQKVIYLHRLLLSTSFNIDHRDRNGLNNRRYNLRPASQYQNARNCDKRAHNTSGFKGVSFHKLSGKWQAVITFFRKQRHLGLFKTRKAASSAYDAASLVFHKEFSSLNK